MIRHFLSHTAILTSKLMYSSPCFLSATLFPSVFQCPENILASITSREGVFIGIHLLFLHFRFPFRYRENSLQQGRKGWNQEIEREQLLSESGTSVKGNDCLLLFIALLIFFDTFPLCSLRSRSWCSHKIFRNISSRLSKSTI